MRKGLNSSVSHRIAITAGLLRRMIFRVIAKNDIKITPDQWSVLNTLWEKEGLTVKEIVDKSRKDFANVTRIIEKLEKLEYVTKIKNEKDGRSYIISVTEKAFALKPRIEKCWKNALEISTEGISKEEQKAVVGTLLKIENNVLNYLGDSNDSLPVED